jgi:copper resistance protein D
LANSQPGSGAQKVDEALVAIRAVHFASTAMTAGVLFFVAAIADPIFQPETLQGIGSAFRTRSLHIAWIGLALSALSGVAWVALQTAAMSGLPLVEAMSADVLWVVLSKTQFGIVSDVRLALMILLAIALALPYTRSVTGLLAPFLATVSLLGIAWTGHAAGTVGQAGKIHLAADALHLFAAALWIGGLIPLLLLLGAAREHNNETWAAIAAQATQRFSTLGILSVGALLATGLVNSWILVGSIEGLVRTDYGHLVLAKTAIFGAMVSVATVNRWRLTPQVSEPASSHARALSHLTRNIIIEIMLGLSAFAVVGALGTLHPAVHLVPAQG